MLTAAQRMRSSAKLVGWSPWVVWWSGRSRVEVSCHQTRAVGQLSHVSHAPLCDATQGGVGGG